MFDSQTANASVLAFMNSILVLFDIAAVAALLFAAKKQDSKTLTRMKLIIFLNPTPKKSYNDTLRPV